MGEQFISDMLNSSATSMCPNGGDDLIFRAFGCTELCQRYCMWWHLKKKKVWIPYFTKLYANLKKWLLGSEQVFFNLG